MTEMPRRYRESRTPEGIVLEAYRYDLLQTTEYAGLESVCRSNPLIEMYRSVDLPSLERPRRAIFEPVLFQMARALM